MGHTRLGAIPKLRKWGDIVATFAKEAPAPLPSSSIPDIARRTIEAADPALQRAMDDPGLSRAFFLLTRVVLAARKDEWKARLAEVGINLPAQASLFDLTSELHAAIDGATQAGGRPTDISEMAQAALGQAFVELASPHTVALFGSSDEHLVGALRALSTKRNFGELGQRFFGHFLARFLNSYLSRITAGETGGDNLRQVGALTRFNAQLDAHCIQSARIVRDFCGGWYSKTEYVEGINPENTRRFVAVAIRKLSAEMRRQETER
jgi:hypothetical protein